MNKAFLWILPIFLLAAAVFFVYPVISTTTSSPGANFTILNDTVYLNWTNRYVFGVIINSSADNNTVAILNNTSPLASNYSQSNSITVCTSSFYKLFVTNGTTGNYVNTTLPLNVTNITTMNLTDNAAAVGGTDHRTCAPGRYYTNNFTFSNASFAGENANITVIVDIPISFNNSANTNISNTLIGIFGGTLNANSTFYHSYYFNTSNILNATGVSVNTTGWGSTQNADVWLLSGSTIFAKSIAQNTTDYLSYNFVPAAQMWEARIYGNSSNGTIPYSGYLIYTTLNVTNASDNLQQFSSLNFGTLNASTTNNFNLTLKNEGNITLPNVAFSSNTYRTVRFGNSGAKNFTFLVGDSTFESGIHVSLNWTGASNYTLNLINPSGSLVTTSSNYYINANLSSVNQELANDTTPISPGFWIASVISNNAQNDPYNVTVFVYQTPSWINTNYTTVSLTPISSNVTALVNISVPNSTIDGNYGGEISFTDANKGRIIIPYVVNASMPTLIVQNTSVIPTTMNPISSDVYRIDENLASNLSRVFNLNLTNLGAYDLALIITNSSTLVCTTCGSAFTANLTLNSTNNIINRTSQIINFNVTFNSSLPAGTYDGWIFFNSTNATIGNSSHPYSTYNLTIRLNLTSLLYIQIPNILSNFVIPDNIVRNTSIGENVTIALNVSYINSSFPSFGAQISVLNITNFTSIWLQEKNITTSLGRIPSSGSLTVANGTNPIYCTTGCPPAGIGPDNLYYVNFTVPASQPGGLYTINSIVNFTRPSDSVLFSGQGTNSSTVIINNTGLFMSSNASGICNFDSTCSGSISINPNASFTVYAKVANYGPVTATAATINISGGCSGYTIAQGTSSRCGSASYSSPTWTLNVPAYNNSCIVTWTITAGSSTGGAAACTSRLMGAGATWYDANGVNLTITVSNVTSGGTTGSTTNPANATSASPVYVSITNYSALIYIVQGSANSTIVNVKNTNNTRTQDIGLSISNITTSWYTITPTLRTGITALTTTNFSISFTIPNNTAVANYIGSFAASSNYGNDTKSFTLRVLPSNTTKVLINDTYQLYNLNYTNLYAEVNNSKTAGMNTSVVETDLAAVKAKLDQAQSYISLGDYFSAQQLLNEVKALLDQAHTDYNNLTKSPLSSIFGFLSGNWWIYAAITGGAIAIAIIAYLFWPTKEETKSALFKPKVATKSPGEGNWDKLKSKWSWEKLKNKWKKTT